jgi:hypothetical protein
VPSSIAQSLGCRMRGIARSPSTSRATSASAPCCWCWTTSSSCCPPRT